MILVMHYLIMYQLRKSNKWGEEKLKELRVKALINLQDLAKENIELTIEEDDEEDNFNNMSVTEKKRYIKEKDFISIR